MTELCNVEVEGEIEHGLSNHKEKLKDSLNHLLRRINYFHRSNVTPTIDYCSLSSKHLKFGPFQNET